MSNRIAQEIDKMIEDRVRIAKEQGRKITGFFDNLKDLQGFATEEDIDVALHSLKVAALEIKEKAARKKAEEESAIQAKKLAD